MENYDPKEAVRLGTILLDGSYPGWREQISREDLNMASAEDCILGQLFGDFHDGVENISDSVPINDLMDGTPWTVQFGFLANASWLWIQGIFESASFSAFRPEEEEQRLRDLWIGSLDDTDEF